MKAAENRTIGVIGSGRMGTDIAYFLNELNFNLVWICIDEEEKFRLNKSFKIKTDRLSRNGIISHDELRKRTDAMVISCSLRDISSCDIIIEAIDENAAAKVKLYTALEPFARDKAIVVTNTSSFRPSSLVREGMLKHRFAGLHFFFPVKMKKIVELITTEYTDDVSIAELRDFISVMGKFCLEMPENEGFVLNRLFLDCQAQAVRLHRDGNIDMRAIDAIVKGSIFPRGVFEFFDDVGIDVMRQSVINYTSQLNNRDFYNPLLDFLADLLSRNRLGRKSGSGCYDYPVDIASLDLPGEKNKEEIISLLRAIYINSVFKVLEKKIWSVDDMEFAVKEYMDMEEGPLALAEKIGHGAIREILKRHYDTTGFEAHRPSSLL
ncbi:MAG: 3-hydroxyacyl-CoA dehydrogenase family protein [Spirochaetes bacterium]|nr:3-hydroxyacyl-CoA dehydrogenase family protein [Spirochaetota bacterium]